MLDEDVVLKAPRYENERLLMFYIPAMLIAPVIFGGDGLAAFAIMISLSLLVPVNMITYPRNWVDADDHCGKKFLLALLPVFIFAGIMLFRGGFPMLEPIGNGSEGAYIINENLKSDIFASASLDYGTIIIETLTAISIIAAALSIYYTTQSRFIVRNILAYCSIGIGILAALGLFSEFLFNMNCVSMRNLYGEESFSTVKDASSWSFLAMLWISALMGAGIYTFQRFKLSKFLFSVRGGMMMLVAVLAASALYTASDLGRIFVYAQLAVFFGVYAANVLPTEESLKKHLNTERRKTRRRSKLQTSFPFGIYTVLALAFAFKAFTSYFAYNSDAPNDESRQIQAYHQTIIADTKELIKERPILGWGPESFANAMAFKQGDDIELAPIVNPNSDVLKFITENGYVGLLLMIITPAFFGIRFLLEFKISQSGIIFMASIVSILILSFYSTPFQSASVFYSFWILMFAFFTWEDAEII